jgi:hypothetical protein
VIRVIQMMRMMKRHHGSSWKSPESQFKTDCDSRDSDDTHDKAPSQFIMEIT